MTREERRRIEDSPDSYPQSRAAQRQLWGARKIDGSTHMADTSKNLPLSQPSGTDKGIWDAQFRRRDAAATAPASPTPPPPNYSNYGAGLAETYGNSSINPAVQPKLDALPTLQTLSSPTIPHTQQWGGNSIGAGGDPLMTPKPFMPQSPSRPFTVPRPLTGPMGSKATDAAGLAQNRSTYASGGAAGFWGGSRAPSTPTWQGPSATVNSGNYVSKYGTASVDYDKRQNAAYRWGDNTRAA